ncbi:hypothetical protein [Paenibacillus sp. EKM212P]|uniref:hypothetical protein n=1 Tax=Paenibacillus sp. EKM212P TaxID=1683680 RepID=UPI001EEAD05A|nr:hypothetical protein [Paenibacillus sp. EKM212P]
MSKHKKGLCATRTGGSEAFSLYSHGYRRRDSWVTSFKHGAAEGAEWCWTSEAVAFKFRF